MSEQGMSPMAAIEACTLNVARAYRKDADYGSIEVGKIADLLVVDGDPLRALANAGRLVHVIKDGAPVDVARLPDPPLVTRYPREADFSRH